MLPARLLATLALIAGIAGCASAPPRAPVSSLPEETIVNDPAAEAFPGVPSG